MNAIEYMEKQVRKCTINYEREMRRGSPEEMLANIQKKREYYEEAVEALRRAYEARNNHL